METPVRFLEEVREANFGKYFLSPLMLFSIWPGAGRMTKATQAGAQKAGEGGPKLLGRDGPRLPTGQRSRVPGSLRGLTTGWGWLGRSHLARRGDVHL